MKKLFFIFFLFSFFAYSQQDPLLTQYSVNGMYYNPAVAGSKAYSPFVIQTRQQWLGFEGAPLTSLLSYHGAVNNRSALGGMLVFDKTTPSMQGYLQLNYAYHIPLDYDKVNVSFGLGAKLSYYRVDFEPDDLPPGIDPAFSSQAFANITGDASSGVYFYGRNFYFGYSINNLLESSFNQKVGYGFGSNNNYKHQYGMAAYRFNIIDNDFHLEPSVLIRKMRNIETIYDFSLRFYYLKSNWTGVTYRSNNALAFTVGFLTKNNLNIAYSYDHYIGGEITQYTIGTHELSISINIPSASSQRHISFWGY
tara:strand:- start:992 stop:1915 length:924 start_codon:yes stop_codon:yes gene_type:complete